MHTFTLEMVQDAFPSSPTPLCSLSPPQPFNRGGEGVLREINIIILMFCDSLYSNIKPLAFVLVVHKNFVRVCSICFDKKYYYEVFHNVMKFPSSLMLSWLLLVLLGLLLCELIELVLGNETLWGRGLCP